MDEAVFLRGEEINDAIIGKGVWWWGLKKKTKRENGGTLPIFKRGDRIVTKKGTVPFFG